MSPDLTGLKRYLRRKLSITEIKALSDKAHAALLEGADTVAITSTGFEGSNGSGQLVASAKDIGAVCEDLIEDIDGTTSAPRQMFIRSDFNTYGQAI